MSMAYSSNVMCGDAVPTFVVAAAWGLGQCDHVIELLEPSERLTLARF